MGAYQRLELEWAEFNSLDPKGMVACSSGTAALHLAFEVLQLPSGSEVLCPDYTMVACPRAVVMAGLRPRFVDCDDRLLMSWMSVGEEMADDRVGDLQADGGLGDGPKRTSACLVVHVYGKKLGYPKALVNLGVKMVEDLAEAHGVRPHPSTDAACWSFYKNKIVAGEEGGAVWFKEGGHADLARKLRNLGFTDDHDYFHVPRGHNYRLANCLAERILRPEYYNSLAAYPLRLADRREAEAWYDEFCSAEWKMPPRDAPWVYDIRVPGSSWEIQKTIVKSLNDKGIAARCGFRPMGLQEEFQLIPEGDYYDNYPHQNALRLSRDVLYLPLTPGSVTRELARLAFDTIQDVVGRVER